MVVNNPYRPGAGMMPAVIAGRDQELHEAEIILETLKNGIPSQSCIYTGLRGVGKTVLLNKVEELADSKGVLFDHIEIDINEDFIEQITNSIKTITRKISKKAKFQDLIENVLDALKTIEISFVFDDSSLSIKSKENDMYNSNNLSKSLTDVFIELGKLSSKESKPICFFIDEIQFIKPEELSALITALHRLNQLSYPVMVFGAGLPKILKLAGDTKTYAERLFRFVDIGSLSKEAAEKAVREPAEKFDVTYSDDAISHIYSITEGYPYFIQEICKLLWENKHSDFIDDSLVTETSSNYFRSLDNGFYKVRYERCTRKEQDFLYAMALCENVPCNISDVAKNMDREVHSVSPLRAQLINKGFIYAQSHGMIDFTVPKFSDYLKRNSIQPDKI